MLDPTKIETFHPVLVQKSKKPSSLSFLELNRNRSRESLLSLSEM